MQQLNDLVERLTPKKSVKTRPGEWCAHSISHRHTATAAFTATATVTATTIRHRHHRHRRPPSTITIHHNRLSEFSQFASPSTSWELKQEPDSPRRMSRVESHGQEAVDDFARTYKWFRGVARNFSRANFNQVLQYDEVCATIEYSCARMAHGAVTITHTYPAHTHTHMLRKHATLSLATLHRDRNAYAVPAVDF